VEKIRLKHRPGSNYGHLHEGHGSLIAEAKKQCDNERRAAVVLNRALATGRGLLEQGEKNSQAVIRRITEEIKKEPLGVIEYIEVVDTDKIAETALVNAPVLVALAVRFGKTRLIDNFMFEPR
jgi:pantoate--beta-alanine ligase